MAENKLNWAGAVAPVGVLVVALGVRMIMPEAEYAGIWTVNAAAGVVLSAIAALILNVHFAVVIAAYLAGTASALSGAGVAETLFAESLPVGGSYGLLGALLALKGFQSVSPRFAEKISMKLIVLIPVIFVADFLISRIVEGLTVGLMVTSMALPLLAGLILGVAAKIFLPKPAAASAPAKQAAPSARGAAPSRAVKPSKAPAAKKGAAPVQSTPDQSVSRPAGGAATTAKMLLESDEFEDVSAPPEEK